jgi:hypothetical protein
MLRGNRGRHKRDNPWPFYLLVAGLPMLLVLAVVGFSALPPYTPSQAQAQPGAPVRASAPPPASPSPSASPSPPASPPTKIADYEAEDKAHTTLGSATQIRTVPGASGGLVVTHVVRGATGDVTFRDVAAPAPGSYAVTVYYLLAGGAPQDLSLAVDGRAPTVLTFPPVGGANRIGSIRVVVPLAAGANTLQFSNAAKTAGPELDRITVAPQ